MSSGDKLVIHVMTHDYDCCYANKVLLDDAGYIGSMVGTLYAALAMHSYILSLVCCALQVSQSLMHCHISLLCAPTTQEMRSQMKCQGIYVKYSVWLKEKWQLAGSGAAVLHSLVLPWRHERVEVRVENGRWRSSTVRWRAAESDHRLKKLSAYGRA